MATAINLAAEAFTHVIVTRVVAYLQGRTSTSPVTHDELIHHLTGVGAAAPALVAAPKKSSSKKQTPAPASEASQVLLPEIQASPPAPETQTPPEPAQVPPQETQEPAPETQAPPEPPAPSQIPPQETQAPSEPSKARCAGKVFGKPCIREPMKDKLLCKQCHTNQSKKERDAKKSSTAAAATPTPTESLVPTQVAEPYAEDAPAAAAPAAPAERSKPTQPLVPVDASKNLFRNVRTNWLVYETATESQVVGVMHGEETVPLTEAERAAALRDGYTVQDDPDATQPDSVLVPTQPAQATASAPSVGAKTSLRKAPRTLLPPPPTLPIPPIAVTSTIPL